MAKLRLDVVSVAVGALLALGVAGPARAALPAGNVIVNPNAETGAAAPDASTVDAPPSWTLSSPETTQVQYGASGGFPDGSVAASLGGGSAFFAGGPQLSPRFDTADTRTMTQDIALDAAATEIDRGHVRASLAGLLGGFASDGDAASVTARFSGNANQPQLLLLTIGPVTAAQRSNQTTLVARSADGLLPAGVRAVHVTVTFARTSGAQTYNDGYADNLSLAFSDETPPVVHTTGADTVTAAGARVTGTIDDVGIARTYHVEYGPSTAYGQRTPDAAVPAGSGPQAVSATLGGLAPDTDYHARVVADAPAGAVAGEDTAFHTARPAATGGLPPGLDFTWAPHADVLVAGSPAEGVQFLATKAPGVSYAWDFDADPAGGVRPDPTASGDSPRHGFTADGPHDGSRVKGADGRRRTYVVRLRATAPDGASAEVTHVLTVVPDGPPTVDFVIRRTTTGVDSPVVLVPKVSDPDQTARSSDAIDHLEWDFDTPAAGTAAGGPENVDLVCDGAGANCHDPRTGQAPGPWFGAGAAGAVGVNFWQRALAAHALSPLSAIDLDALPQSSGGHPLASDLSVAQDQTGPARIPVDPRVAYLYDTATLLQQSSFATDAGEATGAQLRGGATLRGGRAVKVTPARTTKEITPYSRYLVTTALTPREITLTAVDAAGARSSITHDLPLTADVPPKLVAQFVNRDPDGSTKAVFVPKRIKVRQRARRGVRAAPDVQDLGHPLTTEDELAFDASSTTDPDGSVAWYALQVGTPLDQNGLCKFRPPPMVGGNGPISLDGNPEGFGPGEFFPGATPGGTGPGEPVGRVGSVLPAAVAAKGLQKVGFRAVPSALPTLGKLLDSTGPYVHPCGEFAKRNVLPGTFVAVPSPAARPPAAARAARISPTLLTPRHDLTFGTTALVTRDPQDLRFRIPQAGTYSVSVAAYDNSGQGAIQRTDGFVIQEPNGTCANTTGEQLNYADHNLGFGGLCFDFGGKDRAWFWTSHDMDVNGVTLRPDPNTALFVDTRKAHATLLATTAPEPNLRATNPDGTYTFDDAAESGLDHHHGGVSVIVDGDPIAHFDSFSAAVSAAWIRGTTQPGLLGNATYKGSPVARPAAGFRSRRGGGPFRVTFEQSAGKSHTAFAIVLPDAFSRGSASTAPTAAISRTGQDEPRSTILTTNGYADIRAARRARAARSARAAAANVAGTIDLSGTSLGPVSITHGNISFNAASKSFSANIDEAWLNVPPKPAPASFHLVIADGELKSADGSVGVTIPVFPGVTLTGLRFQIITDPLTLSGGASFAALNLLTGDLDLTVRPSPLFIRLQGSIGVAGLPLGGAYVQFDSAKANTLTFGGHFGHDFGPASLEVGLDGGISFDTGDFFIQGDGHACLFVCLDVRALVSNIAIAACGSIDFGFTDVSAGFAYRFGDGLDLFTGCDLDPYKPAVFKSRAGPRADLGTGGPIAVPPGTQQVSLRFRGSPGEGSAPKVTVTGPDGKVYRTAAAPGDYAFSPLGAVGVGGAGSAKTPSALVDQDPVDHITTFLIVNPPAGDYRVTLDPGQAPVGAAEVAYGHSLADDALKATVKSASASGDGSIGSLHLVAAGSARAAAKGRRRRLAVPRKALSELRRLPPIERSRLRGVVLSVPAGLQGRLNLLDVDGHGTTVLAGATLTGAATKVPFIFDPGDTAGAHHLEAFLTHTDGVPRKVAVVDDYPGPTVPAPTAPKLTLRHDGSGATVLDVSPGTAGGLASPASVFDLVASSSSGRRIERLVDARDARSLGHGRFRVVLGHFAPSETVKVVGRMDYGDTAGRAAGRTLHGR